MDRPRIYYMSKDKLTEFVRDKAQPGDIAFTCDSYTNHKYVYCCTPDNIGPNAEPVWFYLDTRWLLRRHLNSMTLGEKVDFLIDKYIEGV